MKMSFAEAILRQARLVAVNLAYQTQPFGDSTGRAQGEGRIQKDLAPPRGILKPLNKYWMSEAIRMQQYAPENFIRRFTNKRGEVWLTEEDKILTSLSAIKDFHKSMRVGSRQRTSQAGNRDRTIGRTKAGNRGAVDQDKLATYIKQVQKNVGIAKAGWASCAQQLLGTRGIPQWVTRHIRKKPLGDVQDATKNEGSSQYVRMTNRVPWIDQCLNPGQIQRALDIQRGKMVNAIQMALSRAR